MTRAPWWDEGVYADVAQHYARNGTLASDVQHPNGVFGGMPGVRRLTYWTTPLYPMVVGLWFRAAGVGLFEMRAFSSLLAVPFLFCWWYVVRYLTGSSVVACVAAALIALDAFTIRAMVTGRPDLLAAALATVGMAFYLRFREDRLNMALTGATALVALAGLSHPMAAVEAIILVALVLLLDARRIRLSSLALSVGAAVVILLPWAYYVSLDFDTFVKQWTRNLGSGRTSGLANPLQAVYTDLTQRYLGYFFTNLASIAKIRVLTLVGLAVAIVWATIDRSFWRVAAHRVITVLAFVGFIALAILDGARFVQYFIFVFPIYLAFVSCVFAWKWRGAVGSKVLVAGLICCISGTSVAGLIARAFDSSYATEYKPTIATLKRLKQDGERIIGPSELAFDLGFDQGLMDDILLRENARIVVLSRKFFDFPRARGQRLRETHRVVHQTESWTVFVREADQVPSP